MNFWFASVIHRNESLQAHPMKLFKYIAVSDSIYYSNQFFSHVCCGWHFPELLASSVFFGDTGYHSYYRALWVQFLGVQTIEIFGLAWNASLNFCLMFDLITMMKSPFSDKRKYMLKYLVISSLVAFFLAIGCTIEITDHS